MGIEAYQSDSGIIEKTFYSSAGEMLHFTLKNLLICTVKMSDIQCVGSLKGPEHSHISVSLELLGKVFL